MVNKTKLCKILVFMAFAFCYGESDGEKAFKQNNPSDAVILLESEITNGTASSLAYNYLGLSYYQLGQYEQSVNTFSKGLSVAGTNKKILAYNQGNSYFALRDFENAAKSYSLALTADPSYYDSLLNRANAYLMGDQLSQALNDYKKYIIVVPDDPQESEIRRMISMLEGEIANREVERQLAEEEAARIAEEEKRMQEEMARLKAEEERLAEEERIAKAEQEARERAEREAEEAELKRQEEERKAAEAERRRKLLEDVANSLHNTDSTNMSAGAEDLIDYEQESELD